MGTPFTSGQLGKLQTIINIGIATALPKVVEKLNPKITLRSLDGRGDVFAGHLEIALEQALNKMFMLGNNGSVALKLNERHDPDAFFRTRSGLYVYDDFRKLVVAEAKPTEAGAIFKLEHGLLTKNMTDEKIEASLPGKHIFDDSVACAVIATMIAEQSNGKEGKLLNNGYANLFYLSSCVVDVYWIAGGGGWFVLSWRRDDDGWYAGSQVFSLATGN